MNIPLSEKTLVNYVKKTHCNGVMTWMIVDMMAWQVMMAYPLVKRQVNYVKKTHCNGMMTWRIVDMTGRLC
jgi:hypothetical protein